MCDNTLNELDSLLESLDIEDNNSRNKDKNRIGKSDAVEKVEHMVDAIDPDAVDFTPFLQNHSGSAVNYHDESHMITKHHAKLHLQTQTAGILEDLPTPSASHKQKINRKKEKGLFYHLNWGLYAMIDQLYTSVRRVMRKFPSPKGESDRMKYFAAAMLAFILYVMVRGETNPGLGRKTNRMVDTIIPQDFDDAYKDIDDTPLGIMDTPIYWHIPRSGGSTVKLVMSMCMGRVVACEQGAGHQLDEVRGSY